MRCSSCDAEYEDHVRTCADCGRALVPGEAGHPAPIPDARLGRFHPSVATAVSDLLDRRGVAYTIRPGDDEVEIVVDRLWRDDLRTELTMMWPDLVGRLDPEAAATLRPAGGSAPGWHDAPRGGHVDRLGRMVVDTSDDEEREADAARAFGPAMLTAGAITVISGWYLVDSPALIVLGVGLALVGLLVPR